MSTFGEKLAAAREARPSKDVQVILDGEFALERERLMAELKNADTGKRLASKSPAEEIQERLDALAEAAKDSIVTLRFKRLSGRVWADLTSRNPVRVDVPIDKHYGYNYDAVCEAAASLNGVRVDGDEEVALTTEEWSELFDVLSGAEIGLVRDAVWELNEWEPSQRLQSLVKGFGAATRSDSK